MAVVNFGEAIALELALTVFIGNEAFYAQLEKGLFKAYFYASEVMVTNMLARNAEEGISFFNENRKSQMGRWLNCCSRHLTLAMCSAHSTTEAGESVCRFERVA